MVRVIGVDCYLFIFIGIPTTIISDRHTAPRFFRLLKVPFWCWWTKKVAPDTY